MQVDLTLSLVHNNHLHPISTIIMVNVDQTPDEIIDEFCITFAKELSEVISFADKIDNKLLLISLFAAESLSNPVYGLAAAIFLLSKRLDLKEIILVLECNGVTKTVNPIKPQRYS